MKLYNKISAFRTASADLQISISSPFEFISQDKQQFLFPLHLNNFGSKSGTLIFDLDPTINIESLSSFGFFITCISDLYSNYDRERFIDMLNDLGYFGPEDSKPAWYTGNTWTE